MNYLIALACVWLIGVGHVLAFAWMASVGNSNPVLVWIGVVTVAVADAGLIAWSTQRR